MRIVGKAATRGVTAGIGENMPGRVRPPAGAVAGSGTGGLPAPRGGGEPLRQAEITGRRRLAQWAAIGVPGLAVLLLDGYDLGSVPLWRDEAYTVDVAHRSLSQIFALLGHTNAVNGAYYVLIHGVIGVLGASTAALRLPSLAAIAVAAVVTAATGARLARAMALPAPAVTGLLTGLVFAAAPLVTWYAQDARTYAIVTMLATIATYLLLRAMEDRRWWVGYAVAIMATGLFSVLALLLLPAHGTTMLIVSARRRSPAGLGPWLAAAAAAVIALTPLLRLGYDQRTQISWLRRPGPGAVTNLMTAFSGSKELLPLVGFAALGGVAASFFGTRRGPVDAATLALPWLVLPPAILLAVSQVHPVYDGRYVMFCLPALALLAAAGLSWLAGLLARTPLARTRGALAWLPSAVLVIAVAALLAGPQRSVRRPSSRADNLRAEAAALASHELPGDAVIYLPPNRRVDSMAYPGPFRLLRDIALEKSPLAASNLLGRDVNAQVLRRRFAGVQRVWVVSGRGRQAFVAPRTSIQKAEVAELHEMHLAWRWYVHDDMLSLYVRA